MSNGYDMLNPIDDGEVVDVDMREELQQVSTGGGILGVAINGETQPYDETGRVDIPLDVTKVGGKYVANNATSAKSAEKLSNGDAGSAKKPIYQKNGEFIEIDHKIESDVPADAKFTDTTYEKATPSLDGLLSKEDKKKLDSIEEGGTKIIVDSELSDSSTNPVENKAIAAELKRKANASELGAFAKRNELSSSDVGLGNVTNDAQVKRSEMGVAGGVATLGDDGRVPTTQLPSFVDDIEEFPTFGAFPYRGEAGKIYLALDTNLAFRWSGSSYVPISQSLALGETSSTAYAGDKGKKNAEDIASILNGTTTVPNANIAQRAIRSETLGDETVGSAIDPIYLDNGNPVACDLRGYLFKDIKADHQDVTSAFVDSLYNKTVTSYTVTYDTRNYDNSHIKVGDTVYITLNVTDKEADALALGVARQISTQQNWLGSITFDNISVVRGWKGDKGEKGDKGDKTEIKELYNGKSHSDYYLPEMAPSAYYYLPEVGNVYRKGDFYQEDIFYDNNHIAVGDMCYEVSELHTGALTSSPTVQVIIFYECVGEEFTYLNTRAIECLAKAVIYGWQGEQGPKGDKGNSIGSLYIYRTEPQIIGGPPSKEATFTVVHPYGNLTRKEVGDVFVVSLPYYANETSASSGYVASICECTVATTTEDDGNGKTEVKVIATMIGEQGPKGDKGDVPNLFIRDGVLYAEYQI